MSTNPLIGRSVELDRLGEAVDDVHALGRALLVSGEPGIGKSTLVDAVIRRACGRGYRLLQATGVESEEQLAFAGLERLLSPIMGAADALPGTQRKALGTALGLQDGPPPQVFLVGLAALNMVGEVASRQPVMIAVDDVQWLDGPTQEVLAFLARRLAADPVVMVAVIRTGHSSPLLLAGLEALTLKGLGDSSAREVLALVAGDLGDGERERILLQAMGNPLALVELPAAWRSAGTAIAELVPQLMPLSGRLERAFAARLSELPSLTRDALLVAAVDAEDDVPEILAATSTLSGCAVDGAVLEPAVEAGLLEFDLARLRFRHPLVKSGILQAESTTRRHQASAALADVLLNQPLRRTWYRAQATIGPDDEVADELEEAHAESLRRGSVTAAISALERAAQLTSSSAKRGHRLLLAAELGFGLGQADLVRRLLGNAAHHALSDLDVGRLEWLRELPDSTDLRSARRISELSELAGRAAAASDIDLALNLLVAAAVRCHWGWPASEVRDRVVTATESLAEFESDPRYVAAIAVAQPLLRGRRVAALLSRAAAAGLPDPDGLALYGMAAFAVGDQLRAADFLTQAEAGCRVEGRFGLLTQVLALRSAVGNDLGEWREAATAADEARRLASETHQSTWRAGTLGTIARNHALRGDVPLAMNLAAELENTAGARGNTCSRASAVLARGFALLSADRHLEAFDALRRLFDPADPSCHERERMPGVMFLAEAAAHAGRHSEARRIVSCLEVEALEVPSPLLHNHLLYARAVLADDRDAEPLYHSALEHDLVRWPLLRARLELAYGSWLRRQRRASEARAPLRSAHATLEWIGADKPAERARSELRATGERMTGRARGPSRLSWQETLTPQELHIAGLAAEGLSNREIAERLFMSHRTVGAHLHHIFPKLDITSRVQLAALFSERK
jgi:DNA-binding CsgD family transcriptional regulator